MRILMSLFYKYSTVDAFNLLAIPDKAELCVEDLIRVSKSGDPCPRWKKWLPPHSYIQRSNGGKVEVQISSKFSYTTANKKDSAVGFLPAGKVYAFKQGALEYRVARDIDLVACLSFLLSVIALGFTGNQFLDQREELELAKSPVWASRISLDGKEISFVSPNQDLQLQQGFLGFHPRYGMREVPLYVPEMKANLEKYIENLVECYSNFPRAEKAISVGGGRIFDTVSVVTQYTYKGELRGVGMLYRLFIDVEVPPKSSSAKPVVKLLGTSFHRFFKTGENIESSILNDAKYGETELSAWRGLIYNPEKKFFPKTLKLMCGAFSNN